MKTYTEFVEELENLNERKFIQISQIPRKIQMAIAKVVRGKKKYADDPRWAISDDNELNNWLYKNAAVAGKRVGDFVLTHLGGLAIAKPVGNTSQWMLMAEERVMTKLDNILEGVVIDFDRFKKTGERLPPSKIPTRQKGDPPPPKKDIPPKTVRPEKDASLDEPLKVGDILYTSWGYDQTNVDFYQVRSLTKTGKSVVVQQIHSQYVPTGPMQGKVTPMKDNFVTSGWNSEKMTKRILGMKNGKGRPYLKISKSAHAWLWDGKSKYVSSYH